MPDIKSESLEDIFSNMSIENNDTASANIKDMSSEDKASTLSELDDREIGILTRLDTLSAMTGIIEFTNIGQKFKILKISRKRQSRKEMVEILKASLLAEIEKNKRAEQLRGMIGDL